MPTAASAALRAAVHDALAADSALAALLGGAKVYDEPPRAAAFPYVTLGETRITDWSPGSDTSEEHQLTLHAWSRQGGHAQASNRWRELLDGAGVKRASISGRGLFKDAASDALMRQTFFDGAIAAYQIVIPDFGTVQGAFQLTSLEFAGEHNGEVTYDVALESAGELTFAAA